MSGGAERHRGRLSILTRLQLGLEALYRVETQLEVEAFVIDAQQRESAGVARAPREQLLVQESGEEMSIALFVAAGALANLERHDPAELPLKPGRHGGRRHDLLCLHLYGHRGPDHGRRLRRDRRAARGLDDEPRRRRVRVRSLRRDAAGQGAGHG